MKYRVEGTLVLRVESDKTPAEVSREVAETLDEAFADRPGFGFRVARVEAKEETE